MIKEIEKEVGCLSFQVPDADGNMPYGLDNMKYTSSDPNDWRDEDVEWICKSLVNVVKKHPIIRIDYIGKGWNRQFQDFFGGFFGKFFNAPLLFKITYEIKVPRTTFKANAETVRGMILMECI